MDAAPGQSEPRLHELRVTRIADAALRLALARRLAERFPAHAVQTVVAALAGSGFITRVRLHEGEAPALLRELYAAGAPPAAVRLVPADLAGSRHEAGEEAAERAFSGFARRGGRFVPTWNWTAFVFGPLWYLRKGLYAKGLLLLLPLVLPIGGLAVSLAVSLLAFVYCGLVGNWDYYLWKVERTQWW
ncbi:MAG: DUF2628 domain-containing protein [Candidatus Rokubacteria bacterium]|nr:DUF2628 domain-containing protein [Candidatus Rokubacteria bacterium]